MIPVVIQARMSSARLPGKVLRPINDQPILGHVAMRCAQAVGQNYVVIATSQDASDDPVVAFAQQHSLASYRGPLNDVYARFVGAVQTFDATHFIRVCADSPFLDPSLIETAIALSQSHDVDLITNVYPRSYPKGQSVELVRTSTFLDPSYAALPGFLCEHVTQGFYQNMDQFDVVNFSCPTGQDDILETWAIDTPEDFTKVSTWAAQNPAGPAPFGTGQVIQYTKGRADA